MIEEIKDSIINTLADIIINPCGDKGVMDTITNKEIKNKYPQVYRQYRNKFRQSQKKGDEQFNFNLGSSILTEITSGELQESSYCDNLGNIITTKKSKIVISCLCLEHYGENGNFYLNCEALKNALIITKFNLMFYPLPLANTVAITKPGKGLYRGDETEMIEVLEEIYLDGYKIYIHEETKNG